MCASRPPWADLRIMRVPLPLPLARLFISERIVKYRLTRKELEAAVRLKLREMGGEELGDFDHEGLTSSTKGFLKEYGEDLGKYLAAEMKAKQQWAIKQHENSCLSKV